MTPIPMLDVPAQNAPFADELRAVFDRLLHSGRYINGPDVVAFEAACAEYVGVKHAIGVSSGTDALLVSLMALDIGPGDEVITTPFTFFATGGCVSRLGATPVFVDIDPVTFNIDPQSVAKAMTDRTKAVMPVHLFGQSCDMEALRGLVGDVPIIEDAAQALGAGYRDARVGSIGQFGCFSFFPSKNLGGFGDGGLITTNDDALADKARVIRAHGSKPKYFHKIVGGNFRLDALQAALLHVKLAHLEGFHAGRRANAKLYDALFAEASLPAERLTTPKLVEAGHVYNQYVIRTDRRDALKAHLDEQKIGNAIYYPKPLHLQECFASLGYVAGQLPVSEKECDEVLALPIFAGLGEERLRRVAQVVIDFLS